MVESAELKLIAEDTLLVEFGDRLDDELYSSVLALDSALNESPVASHLETLPTFRSLMIKFDVFAISFDVLRDTLFKLDTSNINPGGQKWRVPVCLEGECAQDLSEASAILKLSKASIVERLLAAPLKLYMYGFAPGFAYLGGLDRKLHINRRDSPRSPMPKGALMIAGGLASLTSVSMPTGWYVLGQTPVSMFSLKRKSLVPFAVGDELQLYQIGLDEFAKLQASSNMEGVEKITI
jgi:inhibitor of KinA